MAAKFLVTAQAYNLQQYVNPAIVDALNATVDPSTTEGRTVVVYFKWSEFFSFTRLPTEREQREGDIARAQHRACRGHLPAIPQANRTGPLDSRISTQQLSEGEPTRTYHLPAVPVSNEAPKTNKLMQTAQEQIAHDKARFKPIKRCHHSHTAPDATAATPAKSHPRARWRARWRHEKGYWA